MAQGAASPFQRIFHAPGNPQLPVLPNAADPKEGILPVIPKEAIASASVVAIRIPQTVLPVSAAAPGVADGFAQFYLNGIGGTPNPVEYGDITATKTRTVTVHNTFRDAVEISAVDLTDPGLSGVTLLSPGLPISIPAFSSQVFTFEAALIGDPTVDGEAIFTHDVPGSFTIRMTGRRVIIFATVPQRPIIEQLTFGTDVMDSHDGSEQVMTWRTTPRSIVQYDIRHTDDAERTAILNTILSAGYLLQGVQLWYQARQLTTAAAAVDTVIQVPTIGLEIAAGDTLSFVLPDKTTTNAEVLSLTASDITLTAAIGLLLPVRTFVMPVKFGFMESQQGVATFATAAEDLRVKFTLIEYDNVGFVDPVYFDAHPVDALPIPKAPLFFDGQSRGGSIRSDASRLDGRSGQMIQARSQVIGRPGNPMLVHLPDFATIDAWRKFLHALRGSWGLFYNPSGTNDLPIVDAGFTLGGNTLDVPNMGLTAMGNHAPRRDVRVTVAGVSYDRRIVSWADNGATEQAVLSDIIPGAGVIFQDAIKIEWLTLSRIVGDSATFKHTVLGVAELRFSIRGVIIP